MQKEQPKNKPLVESTKALPTFKAPSKLVKRGLRDVSEWMEPDRAHGRDSDKSSYSIVGDVGVFHLSGMMDSISGLRHFRKRYLKAIVDRKKFLLDLAKVPYLDSTAIGEIVGLKQALEKTGGSLRICNAGPKLMEVLAVLDLDRELHNYASVKSALDKWLAVDTSGLT